MVLLCNCLKKEDNKQEFGSGIVVGRVDTGDLDMQGLAIWSTVFNSLFFLPPGSALQPEAARPRFPALASSYDLRTYQGVNLRERCVELMAEVPPESLGRNSVRADAAGYRIVVIPQAAMVLTVSRSASVGSYEGLPPIFSF